MGSEKQMILMNLDEAINNTNILGSELAKIHKDKEDNVADLTDMLYSIPRYVIENRKLHSKFMQKNSDGEENFNHAKDNEESATDDVGDEGKNLRLKLMDEFKAKDTKKNSYDDFYSSYDDDIGGNYKASKTDETNGKGTSTDATKTKETATDATKAKETAADATKDKKAAVDPTKAEKAAVDPTKAEKAGVDPTKAEKAAVDPTKIKEGAVDPTKIKEAGVKMPQANENNIPAPNNKNNNTVINIIYNGPIYGNIYNGTFGFSPGFGYGYGFGFGPGYYGNGFGFGPGYYGNGFGFGPGYYGNGFGQQAYNVMPSPENAQRVEATTESPTKEVPQENNSQNAQEAKTPTDLPAKEAPQADETNAKTEEVKTEEEKKAEEKTEENKEDQTEENATTNEEFSLEELKERFNGISSSIMDAFVATKSEEIKVTDGEKTKYEELFKDFNKLGEELKEVDLAPNKCKDLKEKFNSLLGNLNTEENLKKFASCIPDKDLEKIISNAGVKKSKSFQKVVWKWQDDSTMEEDPKAKDLREEARKLALEAGETNPYAMATSDGIEKLGEFLKKVLKYSSGRLRKNKPIAELVRNFNSMKSIESHIIGKEENLKIVAEEEDLKEITENAQDPTPKRKVELSMEKTSENKAKAFDKFNYSEKLEVLLRNALYDIYNNNKVKVKDKNGKEEEILENQKAINTGKILLPLLRTKNEPKVYNYDFQYDVLKEIIRQEDFFIKYKNKYPSKYDKKSGKNKHKVNSIYMFALLRYLRTILNTDTTPNVNDKTEGNYFIKTEMFKNSLTIALDNAENNITKPEDYTCTKNNADYNNYLCIFQNFINKDKSLTNMVKDINTFLLKSYDKTELCLKRNRPVKIDIAKLKMKLKNLYSAFYKSAPDLNGIKDLYETINDIVNNFENFDKVMEICGQGGFLENLSKSKNESTTTQQNKN